MINYRLRIERWELELSRTPIDAALVNRREDIRYLCGFDGYSGVLLWTPRHCLLLTDFTHLKLAEKSAGHVEVRRADHALMTEVAMLMLRMGIRRIGYDPYSLRVSEMQQIECHCPGLKFVSLHSIPASYRLIKEPVELNLLRKSYRIADRAFRNVLVRISPGMTEKYVAGMLDFEMRKLGADAPAFETTVLFGRRSVQPHGFCSNKKLLSNEVILLDFGSRFQGYHSDLTRMIFQRRVDPILLKLNQIVGSTLKTVIDFIKPGVRVGEVARLARSVIEKAGFDRYYQHALGHGIGLEIHEDPLIIEDSDFRMEPGMVFSIEPGIYLPRVGGCRREEMVIVNPAGCETLCRQPLRDYLI